jgi:hypothetical protein
VSWDAVRETVSWDAVRATVSWDAVHETVSWDAVRETVSWWSDGFVRPPRLQIDWREFRQLGEELRQRGALTGFDEHGVSLVHVAPSPTSKVPCFPLQQVTPSRLEDGSYRAAEWKAAQWTVVSSKPTVLRRESTLDSQRLGSLSQGSLVTVIETVNLADGTKRGRIHPRGWITLVSSEGKALCTQSEVSREAAAATSHRNSSDARALSLANRGATERKKAAAAQRRLPLPGSACPLSCQASPGLGGASPRLPSPPLPSEQLTTVGGESG